MHLRKHHHRHHHHHRHQYQHHRVIIIIIIIIIIISGGGSSSIISIIGINVNSIRIIGISIISIIIVVVVVIIIFIIIIIAIIIISSSCTHARHKISSAIQLPMPGKRSCASNKRQVPHMAHHTSRVTCMRRAALTVIPALLFMNFATHSLSKQTVIITIIISTAATTL